MSILSKIKESWRTRSGTRRALRHVKRELGASRGEMALFKRDPSAFIRVMLEKKSFSPGQILQTFSTAVKWTTFSVANAITNGVQKNVWVYACTTLLATTSASVPFVVKRLEGDEWVAEKGPLQALIDRPNDDWAWPMFAMHVSYNKSLGGGSFITKVRSDTLSFTDPSQHPDAKGKSVPIALWAHPINAFKIIVDKTDGMDIIKEYKARYKSLTVPPEDMIYFQMPRADDPWKALAPLESAWTDIQIDNAAADFQKYGLDNRAVLSGIIALNELPDATGSEILDEFKEDFADTFGGTENSGNVMVTPANKIQYIDLAKTARDIDFMKGRSFTRENICAAFGVPPVLVGILDRATYSNFEQAQLSFWQFAIIPFLRHLQSLLNAQLVPEFGDPAELRIDIDLSDVDALWPQKDARAQTAINLVSSGVPWKQANALAEVGLEEWDGWDKSLEGNPSVPDLMEVMRGIGLGEVTPQAAVLLLAMAYPSVSEANAQALVKAQTPAIDTSTALRDAS